MRCPRLQECRVRYCAVASSRTMVPHPAAEGTIDRCDSPEWVQCSLPECAPARRAANARCPFLQEVLAERCLEAAVPRFVPLSGDLNDRCHSAEYLRCPSWLERGNEPRRRT